MLGAPAATPASVHLTERMALGATKKTTCAVSPDIVIAVDAFPQLRHGRGGAEGIKTSVRARASTLVSALLPRAHISSYVVGGRAGVGRAL